jgi:ionotropic glutamate receptor
LVNSALDLLEREVVAIIGPETSEVAEFILLLGDAAQVPVVSFSVTNPLLSNHRFPYFVRMAHSDALQMHAIAALVQAYGWKIITAVYTDDEFGTAAVSSLSDSLRDGGSAIEYRSAISPTADPQAIREQLYRLMTMQSRVFVAHMHSDLGSKFFIEAHKLGMMDSGYVWINTDEFTSLWDVQLNTHTMESMQGLLGVKTYIQNSNKLEDFTRRWKRQFRLENPVEEKADLNLYGLFAYDAVWMIAQAIGKLGNISFNFSKPLILNNLLLGIQQI